MSDKFAKKMASEFEMSMVSELSFFLGLETEFGIFVSQPKYARELLKKFGMISLKHLRSPTSTTVKLSLDSVGKDFNETLYRSMIGSLLYLTASRPDISYRVGVCARYQSKPKKSHVGAVKRIMNC